MLVLVLGHRRGITRALEELDVPFVIWSPSLVKTKTKAQLIIKRPFPEDQESLKTHLQNLPAITHVIAGTENAVFPASKIRLWLKSRRNPLNVIIRCTDKLKMKEFLKQKNVPMTDFVGSRDIDSSQSLFERLGTPVVAKPRRSSGGRGIELLDESSTTPSTKTDKIFERKIDGTEGSVESLIVDSKLVFTNVTQYFYPKVCNLIPGHYESEVVEEILSLNLKVIEALNIQWGMTHLEFYCTSQGLLFGEIALRPPGGYIMEALKLAYGVNFWKLFVMIELGFSDLRIPISANQYSASYVIYPPVGKLKSIPEQSHFANIASLAKLKLKMKVGDIIRPREGVGSDFGYVLFRNNDKSQLLRDLQEVQQILVNNTVTF